MADDLVVLGGPGAGKDTQADRLASVYDRPKLDAGTTLRGHADAVLHDDPADAAAHGRLYATVDGSDPFLVEDYTELPADWTPYTADTDELPEYQVTMDEWLPDPPHDETTALLLHEELEQPRYDDGVVLSGYPRTKGQAELFEWLPVDPAAMIVIDVSREEAIDRVTERGRDAKLMDRIEWQYRGLARINGWYIEEARDGQELPPLHWIDPDIADQDEEAVWAAVDDIASDALDGH